MCAGQCGKKMAACQIGEIILFDKLSFEFYKFFSYLIIYNVGEGKVNKTAGTMLLCTCVTWQRKS